MRLYILPYFICIGIISLTTLMLTSCTDRHNDSIKTSLSHIDTLMFSNPDSALSLLDRLPDSITDCEIAAWRDFLTIKTLDKAYQPLPCDSIIAKTVAHYANRGDSLETQSLYYYGYQLMLDNRYDKALVTLYQSNSLAVSRDDYRYAAFSAQSIGDVYANLSILDDELVWTKKAYEYFDSAKMPLHAAVSRLTNLNAQIYTDSIDQAEALFKEIDPLLFQDNKYFSNYYLSLKFDIEYSQKRYDQALLIVHEISDISLLNANKWCKIAECYLKTNNISKCLECLDSAENHINTPIDEAFYKRTMSLALYEKKDYKNAFIYSHDWGNEISVSDLNLICHPGTRQLMDHYRLEYQIQHLKHEIEERNSIIKYGLIISLLITCILFTLYLYNKTKNINTKLKQSNTELSKNLKSANEGILANINSEMMTLFSNYFKNINDLIGKSITASKTIPNLNNTINIKIDRIYNELTSDTLITQIEKIINCCDKNWMAEFRIAYPNLPKDDYRLAIYCYLGFGKETIAVLLKLENCSQVRSRRYNLKTRLLKERSPKQSIFFHRLGLKDKE